MKSALKYLEEKYPKIFEEYQQYKKEESVKEKKAAAEKAKKEKKRPLRTVAALTSTTLTMNGILLIKAGQKVLITVTCHLMRRLNASRTCIWILKARKACHSRNFLSTAAIQNQNSSRSGSTCLLAKMTIFLTNLTTATVS